MRKMFLKDCLLNRYLVPLMIFVLAAACDKKNKGPETMPTISFSDVPVAENSGKAELKISLSEPVSGVVSVNWSTSDGTAKIGADFAAVTDQTLVFQPNETEKIITVNLVDDDIKEADEIFYVNLSRPVNATLLQSKIIITIRNNDTKIGFSNTGFDAPTTYAGYSLSWNDEFNQPTLDPSTWSYETGDGCPTLCGWGNNELQYYSSSPDNLFFQDGKMIIEARAETFGGKNYTSSRIKTQGKRAFKFGRIDIRAILPVGKGLWPAFWLLPQDNVFGGWPRSGEIDMMEYIGGEPSKVLGTVHYGPGPGSTYITRSTSLTAGTFNDKFHVFSLEWETDQIRWYLDGNLYTTISKADIGNNNYPFNENFYLLINMAVGGNLPGAPDASTSFPQHLIIDYIRVFQK
ncbi:family 16 glycosylhydrolase [Flavitalea sp.]|nr:family 16 glycosylhydrolase [Flavitalea sp.]